MRSFRNSRYQLKVTLVGIAPPVWRRLIVPGELSLAGLHRVIQLAMGWDSPYDDYHLHDFRIGGTRYANAELGERWGEPILDEGSVSLAKVVKEKDRFAYLYDFGDSWEHRVTVEKVSATGPAVPVCLAGGRACPPEDCGGVWGYAFLLELLADPSHPGRAEREDWLRELPDPEQFSPDPINRSLELTFSSPTPVAAGAADR